MASAAQTLKGLGPQRMVALGAAGLILLLFFGVLITRVSNTDLKLLYSDLSSEDTNRIVAQLETMGVNYAVDENGTAISVSPADVGRSRIRMAELGLPNGGNMGYELFDKDDTFGTSTFKQQLGRLRALEGELSRTIIAIEQIRNARVHLVLPERQLFSRERQKASASVFVQVIGSKKLAREQISAIQHLVASSVPELSSSMVSIVDHKGNLIARGEEADDEQAALESSESARVSFEKRLQQELEALVESVVGFGNVKARVHADMDFDRITQNEEIFDPESQVARSTQTVEDNEQSNEQERSVTVENNLPEAVGGTNEDGITNNRTSNRTEETVNYEISKTVKSQIRQGGSINRLSVALLIDGIYKEIPADAKDKDAKPTKEYEARSADQLAQIETLVKSAMGYDQDRGDQLEVVNMQFANFDDVGDVELTIWDKMDFSQYVKIAETVILSLVGLLVLLLVVRPMMNKLLEPAPEAANAENSDLMLAASGLAPALEAPDGGTMPALATGGNPGEDGEEMINLDRVEGKIKASSVKKIGEIIDKHPEEAMQIVRSWIYETA